MNTSIMRAAAVALLAAGPLAAQEGGQDLSQAASDPTAALMNFQLQNSWGPSLYNSDGSQNLVQFRAVIPWRTGELQHIFRATVPFFTDTASGATGVSDTILFDLVTFDATWGRWGVGVVGLVPTGDPELGAEKWGLGPAAGFTAQNGRFLWGLFNQNIFTVAGEDDRPDVNLSILQPILNYSLGNGWSVGNSEMTATYDWEVSDWASLPLGVKVAKLVRPGRTPPIQFILQYEHNFADDFVVPKDLYSFGVKLLLPAG